MKFNQNAKDRDRILKSSKMKQGIYIQRNAHKLTYIKLDSMSQKTMMKYSLKTKTKQSKRSKGITNNTLFRFEGKIQSFMVRQQFRKCIPLKPVFQDAQKALCLKKKDKFPSTWHCAQSLLALMITLYKIKKDLYSQFAKEF